MEERLVEASALRREKLGRTSFLHGGRREPLLLLHGIPGSSRAWEKAGRLLTEHFAVIIPDLLGFGESDSSGDDYYMEAQATAVKELVDALGLTTFYLGGHDFGGPVALTLMHMFPELTIRGLVLSSTNTFTDTYVPPPLRLASIPGLNTVLFKTIAGNRLGLGMMYLAATKQKSEFGWSEFSQHLTPAGMDYTRRIFQHSLADLKTNYQRIQNMLPAIHQKTLILWGDSDPFFAVSVGERIQHAIPPSKLKVLDETGHFVPEERPNLIALEIAQYFARE